MDDTKREWVPYFDGRLKYDHPDGFTVIVPAEREHVTPFDCPVCGMVMTTADDANYYRKLKCCYSCGMKWADARRERWLAGWRPSASEIEATVAERKLIPINVNWGSFER